MNIDDLDQTPRSTEQQRTHALTWMNRSLAVIAAAVVAWLLAFVVLEGVDRLPAPPTVNDPPAATELPVPKLIDQYPILQPCVTVGEDNCWRPDVGAGRVTLDGMTYTLDDGTLALEPCVTEDQTTDCYWDAGVRGTDGRSFQVRGGFIYYTDGESYAVGGAE